MMNIAAIIEGIEVMDIIITTVAGSHVVSEILPHMKKVKSNSTLQLGFNILKVILSVFVKTPSNHFKHQ